jgi:mannose/fructose-specific phosphotransferase system component IIA
MNNKLLIVTHGDLGDAVIGVARKIIGNIDEETVFTLSNEGLSTAELSEKIRSITSKYTDSFFVIATDFPGGSCFIAARKTSSSDRNTATVSGVNISMVLSFLTKKELYSGQKLAEVIKTDGNRAILS